MATDSQPASARPEDGGRPFFSVILPTRNRPELMRRALDSVLRQSYSHIEVLVVNDGSGEEYLPAYQALVANYDSRVRWFSQPPRPRGHGPSYSINTGAQAARGSYLCFLDDDDSWEAADHLEKAHQVIVSSPGVDVYYSNQKAYTAAGCEVGKPLWLAVLAPRLSPATAGVNGTHRVAPEFLLSCNGFPHLNCSIMRRELYEEIGGMDEGIRYECEVDLYLRTLGAARQIIYNPAFVARHNVPDAVGGTSVSTAVTDREKRLSQIAVYQKNLLKTPIAPVRDTCRLRLAMLYRALAERFFNDRELANAADCARIALAFRYSLKWHCYSLYLSARAAIRKNRQK